MFSDPLHKSCQPCTWGPNWPCPGSCLLYNILTKYLTQHKVMSCSFLTRLLPFLCLFILNTYFWCKTHTFKGFSLIYVSIYKMWAYQTAGRGGGVRESAVKWSGKNEFQSGKSQ